MRPRRISILPVDLSKLAGVSFSPAIRAGRRNDMDYGFVFFGAIDVYEDAALAEKRGFTHAWLYDSQMLASDVYCAMTLCAIKTKKIFIGPGVTNPSSRIAPMTACSIATINQLAPGRTILGIGTGNTARRTLGMPAAR